MSGDEDDLALSEDESIEGGGVYPKLLSGKNCAKDHDIALLQQFTVRRMQKIASVYKVDQRLNKKDLYKAIFDAMEDDQDCRVCPLGNCNPRTHYFPPQVNPPLGWVRGANGLFAPPQVAPDPQQPPVSDMSDILGKQK